MSRFIDYFRSRAILPLFVIESRLCGAEPKAKNSGDGFLATLASKGLIKWPLGQRSAKTAPTKAI